MAQKVWGASSHQRQGETTQERVTAPRDRTRMAPRDMHWKGVNKGFPLQKSSRGTAAKRGRCVLINMHPNRWGSPNEPGYCSTTAGPILSRDGSFGRCCKPLSIASGFVRNESRGGEISREEAWMWHREEEDHQTEAPVRGGDAYSVRGTQGWMEGIQPFNSRPRWPQTVGWLVRYGR